MNKRQNNIKIPKEITIVKKAQYEYTPYGVFEINNSNKFKVPQNKEILTRTNETGTERDVTITPIYFVYNLCVCVILYCHLYYM